MRIHTKLEVKIRVNSKNDHSFFYMFKKYEAMFDLKAVLLDMSGKSHYCGKLQRGSGDSEG